MLGRAVVAIAGRVTRDILVTTTADATDVVAMAPTLGAVAIAAMLAVAVMVATALAVAMVGVAAIMAMAATAGPVIDGPGFVEIVVGPDARRDGSAPGPNTIGRHFRRRSDES